MRPQEGQDSRNTTKFCGVIDGRMKKQPQQHRDGKQLQMGKTLIDLTRELRSKLLRQQRSRS